MASFATSVRSGSGAVIDRITNAIRNGSKLPPALLSTGFFLFSSSLALIISKTPGAVLVTWKGRAAAAYTYYAVLGATMAFGVAEVLFGLFADLQLQRRNLVAKVLLTVSLLPLAVVVAFCTGLKL